MDYPIGTVQFYISHTCNFSCPNCLSYNNFAIKGHDKFDDYAVQAEEWSKILKPKDMCIIGGEPLSNPYIDSWVQGLTQLFDCEDFKICTNGLLLKKHDINKWIAQGAIIEVNAHTVSHFDKACADIESSLQNFSKSSQPLKNSPKYYAKDYDVFYIVDNKIVALVAKSYDFRKWGVNKFENNEWHLYNSNPRLAHLVCPTNDCHYIYRGELYKCGTIVGAKEFVKKYAVHKPHADLINEYVPIKTDDVDLEQRLKSLKKHIKQCSLCPLTNTHTTTSDTDIKKNTLGLTN